MHKQRERLIVTVQSRPELDAALDQAVGILRPTATAQGVGILVTRLGAGSYEVALDSLVLPGTTKESWGSLTDPEW